MNEKTNDRPKNEQRRERRPRVKQGTSNHQTISSQPTINHNKKKLKSKKKNNVKKKKYYIYFIPFILLIVLIAIIYLFIHEKGIFIKNNNVSSSSDTSINKIQENINKKDNINNIITYNDNYDDWNAYDRETLVKTVLQNDLNDNIRNANDIDFTSLLAYENSNIKILNNDDINEIKYGYSKKTIGLTLNNNKVIQTITPYSSAWLKGLKIGDRILKINGYDINKYSYKQVESMLSDSKAINSTWRFGSLGNYNIGQLSETIPYGDIAEINVNNDILLIRINNITTITAQVIYNLIESKNISGINGIIIDLNGIKNYNYQGIGTLSWLFNGQKEVPIAKFFKNKQESLLYASPLNINMDNNILNKISQIPKLVLVNSNTSGSPEVLAHSISNSFVGTPSSNYYFKNSLYNINNHHIIELRDTIVKLPNDQNIRAIPRTGKQILWPMFLYSQIRNR